MTGIVNKTLSDCVLSISLLKFSVMTGKRVAAGTSVKFDLIIINIFEFNCLALNDLVKNCNSEEGFNYQLGMMF